MHGRSMPQGCMLAYQGSIQRCDLHAIKYEKGRTLQCVCRSSASPKSTCLLRRILQCLIKGYFPTQVLNFNQHCCYKRVSVGANCCNTCGGPGDRCKKGTTQGLDRRYQDNWLQHQTAQKWYEYQSSGTQPTSCISSCLALTTSMTTRSIVADIC